ncbi:hypothetical protein E6W39_29260 [Kitasatospora acidiphila]|uniref:DUF1640 domain-containing protein n=1 Tax=Kitasatospora acidiphila TaxID=2567942 RepID=A0A540WAY9_9ACTN|nr:hypothetical protein [Kitasatospora acidiphila]TQF05574.1 hypothetical protein E6W39_29260 [Kitasatospora acidiphila]
MTAPTSEPTLWELQRALSQIRQDQRDGMVQLRDDLRADIALLTNRLEQVVTKDVYQADQRATAQRIEVLERDLRAEIQDREDDQAKAAAARRWLVGAFIAPIAVTVMQIWLMSKGTSP